MQNKTIAAALCGGAEGVPSSSEHQTPHHTHG